jgi:prepilin-type N-terminal cleavage/methylation domain-containing protein
MAHFPKRTMLETMRRRMTVARDRRRLPFRLGSDSGFTLIELVVTMVILLAVVSTLTGALISATNTEADLNNRFQTQGQARQALAKLTREIHCANQILVTSSGQPLDAAAGSVSGVTLTLPAGCPTGGATAVTALWCTVANGARFDLYRSVTSPCSSSTGVRWATSLVSGTPFSLPDAATTSGNHFPLVHLDLLVNTRTNAALGKYDLVTDVAALNAQKRQ